MATTTKPTTVPANSVREIFETMSWGPAPEADAPVREWLAARESCFGHFIGGAWTNPSAAERFEVLDPSNGKLLAHVVFDGKSGRRVGRRSDEL